MVQSHPCIVFSVVFALLAGLSVAAARRIVGRAVRTDCVILFGDAVKAIFCVLQALCHCPGFFWVQASSLRMQCLATEVRWAWLYHMH